MSKYYELSSETIETFNNIVKSKSIALELSFVFVGAEQKQLIKINKLADQFVFLLNKQIMVTINDELMAKFDEESIKILMEQEIDKISFDINTSKLKMLKTDVNTFSGIVNKYSYEKVAKANTVVELYSQQKKDGQGDFLV